MFNDSFRYLNDIFTIDNPEFEKHIPDIYPTELQLNKAITPDKESSFLLTPAFVTNAITSVFLSLISTG